MGNPDQPDDQNPFDDFFDKFFGGQQGNGPIRERSLGSGVIVDPKGYIVTNRHVVEKADRIRVKLMDDPPGRSHDAKVIGSDQETDLAVIKIDSETRLCPSPSWVTPTACKWAIGCSPSAVPLVCPTP